MKKNKRNFSIKKMAKLFGVSASGYYRWNTRPMSKHDIEDIILLDMIIEIHNKHKKRCGSPKITSDLKEKGIKVSKNRIRRLMKENGLYAHLVRKWKKTTDSSHNLPFAENILNRDFTAKYPGEKWVSDITYIRTSGKWLYLCEIIDLFDRKVVGWSLEDHLETSLVVKAWINAVNNRSPKKGMIFHSDRGVQYCSYEFRNILKNCGFEIRQSMSRKGNCWDNACAESFHSIIKRELHTLNGKYNCEEVKISIFEYIEMYYNRIRRHSTLGYLTPLQKLKYA